MKLEELTPQERLALGGLIRLIIRADGSFSEEEEAHIDRIGDDLGGGREALWRAISDSAQAFKDDRQIRDAVLSVSNPNARQLFLDVAVAVAQADTISPGEMQILSAIREAWGVATTD